MEYLEVGDLSEYLRKMPPLPEAQAQEITYQILDGLNMMHDNDFAHGDLKPNVGLLFLGDYNHNLISLQNILIQSHPPDEWWIKISDFGISKRIEEAPGASTTLRGTSGYIAPELYGLIERGNPFASDIWALGQIVFQLLTNEMAFEDLGALFKYATQANQFPTGRLSKFSALSVEFIT
jgi:serine/threonine protein kinase